MNGLLSVAEIIHELKRYRYDRAGATLGGHRVPLKVFGDHVRVPRQTLNSYIHGEHGMTEATRVRLSQAILDIRAGRLRFERKDRQWRPAGPAAESI